MPNGLPRGSVDSAVCRLPCSTEARLIRHSPHPHRPLRNCSTRAPRYLNQGAHASYSTPIRSVFHRSRPARRAMLRTWIQIPRRATKHSSSPALAVASWLPLHRISETARVAGIVASAEARNTPTESFGSVGHAQTTSCPSASRTAETHSQRRREVRSVDQVRQSAQTRCKCLFRQVPGRPRLLRPPETTFTWHPSDFRICLKTPSRFTFLFRNSDKNLIPIRPAHW